MVYLDWVVHVVILLLLVRLVFGEHQVKVVLPDREPSNPEPKPPVTHQPQLLHLCDPDGKLIAEVTIHRESIPSTYAHGGRTYHYVFKQMGGALVFRSRVEPKR